MVDLALNWTTVPPQRTCEVHASLPRSPLKMRHHASEQLRAETDGCASSEGGDPSRGVVYLEHVQAKVSSISFQLRRILDAQTIRLKWVSHRTYGCELKQAHTSASLRKAVCSPFIALTSFPINLTYINKK